VSLCAVSLAPLAKLQAYKQRMGWSFPWASSHDSDFNYDFQAAITEEQQQSDAVEYNFRTTDWRPDPDADDGPNASPVGTDLATYSRQMPGLSSFAREDGAVYHTYSTYARGLDETTCSSRGNGQINWLRSSRRRMAPYLAGKWRGKASRSRYRLTTFELLPNYWSRRP
jgi:predicted dithiol-disulfide oxidoreductase (DUF899 family)